MRRRLSVAGRTERGPVRAHNEDHFTVFVGGAECVEPVQARPEDVVVAVYDGCGGVRTALAIAEELRRRTSPAVGSGPELAQALELAGRTLASLPDAAGASCTTTVAAVVGADLVLAHIGDTRGYLVRGDRIVRLTADHRLVVDLVAAGRLAPEEVPHHPYENIVVRAFHPGSVPTPSVHRVRLRGGDHVVLCTDGIWRELDDEQIRGCLRGSPARCCDALVDAAIAAGGRDNLAVVVAILDPPEQDDGGEIVVHTDDEGTDR